MLVTVLNFGPSSINLCPLAYLTARLLAGSVSASPATVALTSSAGGQTSLPVTLTLSATPSAAVNLTLAADAGVMIQEHMPITFAAGVKTATIHVSSVQNSNGFISLVSFMRCENSVLESRRSVALCLQR